MCVPLVAFISEESLFVDGKTLLIGSPDAVLRLYLYTCLDAVYYLILWRKNYYTYCFSESGSGIWI